MSLLSRVDTRVLAWTWSIDLVSSAWWHNDTTGATQGLGRRRSGGEGGCEGTVRGLFRDEEEDARGKRRR